MKNIKDLVIVALMSAIMCVLAPLSFPLPFSPVPITMGLLVVFLTAYILKPNLAALSVLIYLILGLVGLPVFSGFSGGVGKIVGPTGGYLIGFLFTAYIASACIHKFKKNIAMHIIGMLLGLAVCYLFGTTWFTLQQDMTFFASLSLCVIPFIPVDIIKLIIAFLLGNVLVKRLKL